MAIETSEKRKIMDSMPTVGMLSTYHKMLPPLLTHCHDYPMNWMSLLSDEAINYLLSNL